MNGTEANTSCPLFRRECRCLLAAAAPEQFPVSSLPEVAIIGRSNAGKSTLINALAQQKNLARASKTPGRTQQIVFFNVDDRLLMADLPGYGHAKAPQEVIKAWTGLIHAYLKYRANLRCVLVLIDSRHGLLPADLDMMHRLDKAAVSYQIILAKADYLGAKDLESRLQEIASALRKHPAARPDVMAVSSKKGHGLEALKEWLATYIA